MLPADAPARHDPESVHQANVSNQMAPKLQPQLLLKKNIIWHIMSCFKTHEMVLAIAATATNTRTIDIKYGTQLNCSA